MKNLKIRVKLMLLTLFMLTILLITGIASVIALGKVNGSTTAMAEKWLPSAICAENLESASSSFRIQELGHIIAQNSADMKQFETGMETKRAEFESYLADYEQKFSGSDAERALLQEIKSDWNNYLTINAQVVPLSRELHTNAAMTIITGTSKDAFDALTETCKELVDFNQKGGGQASSVSDDLYVSVSRAMLIVLVLAVAASLALSLYIISRITRPIHEIDQVAQKIAGGNLNETIHYRSRDELGALAGNFNETVTRLREYVNYIDEISDVLENIANGNLVYTLTYDYAGEFAKVKDALEHISSSLNDTMGQINLASGQVSAGSEHVAAGAQALSQGATEQASSVEELAATVSEISGQVQENAGSVSHVRDIVAQVGAEVRSSNQHMDDMTRAMTEISNASNEIGRVISAIENIAFQTNILALNAAVEAARAGTAGKGFAVVADEVRNLATKSAEASKSTAGLIKRALAAVEHGVSIANQTAASLQRVVEGTETITGGIGRIAEASSAQANAISQVTEGIDQISSVVQTNSATAEESAAASQELSAQAQTLRDLVSRFRLTDGGEDPAPRVSQDPAPAAPDLCCAGDKY